MIGKTIERVEFDYDEALRVFFTDGTMLYAAGVWHNDSTAGITAALIEADQPKSWGESKKFYDITFAQRWDRDD